MWFIIKVSNINKPLQEALHVGENIHKQSDTLQSNSHGFRLECHWSTWRHSAMSVFSWVLDWLNWFNGGARCHGERCGTQDAFEESSALQYLNSILGSLCQAAGRASSDDTWKKNPRQVHTNKRGRPRSLSLPDKHIQIHSSTCSQPGTLCSGLMVWITPRVAC